MNNDWKKSVLYFYARTTGWIVIPAILDILLHKYALSGGQIFIILGLSFAVTLFGLWHEIKKYQKDLEK